MPNEVINAIHRLAAANKKHKGIVFTDKNGNIINDNSPEDADSTEITGVSTGVDNNSPEVADSTETTGARTGVDNIGNTGNNIGNIHDNNIGNTDSDAAEMNMQDNMSATEQETYIGTNDGEEMTAQDGENVHELHGTEEHVPETYEYVAQTFKPLSSCLYESIHCHLQFKYCVTFWFLIYLFITRRYFHVYVLF